MKRFVTAKPRNSFREGRVSLLSTPTVSSVPGEYNLGKRSVNRKFAQISNE